MDGAAASFESVYEFLLKTFGFVAIGIYRHGLGNLPVNALVPIEVFCHRCAQPVQASTSRPFAVPYVYAAPDADAKVAFALCLLGVRFSVCYLCPASLEL
jgi:20S proteasome alpha/beta subunit